MQLWHIRHMGRCSARQLKNPLAAAVQDAFFGEDLAVEARCAEAMAAVRMFEAGHPTDKQVRPRGWWESSLCALVGILACHLGRARGARVFG
jgi:hypothetical protein